MSMHVSRSPVTKFQFLPREAVDLAAKTSTKSIQKSPFIGHLRSALHSVQIGVADLLRAMPTGSIAKGTWSSAVSSFVIRPATWQTRGKDWSACCFPARIPPSHEKQHARLWEANVDVWSKNASNHKKNRIGNVHATMTDSSEQFMQTFSKNAAVLY